MIKQTRYILLVILQLAAISCDPTGIHPDEDNTPPKISFRISPSSGDSTISFVLDGSKTTDKEDINLFLEYRWDLDNDSNWDTEFKHYPYLIRHFPVPGSYRITMEVRDRHGLTSQAQATVTTWGINNDTSSMIDPRDGQSYRIAKIENIWWMAENLNFGTMIPDTQVAGDNGIFEKYSYQNDPNLKSSSGGYLTYYHWDEVMDYDTTAVQGLCPPGWELPTRSDWESLLNDGRGLLSYFSEGGYSRLNLTTIGIHEMTKEWETIDESPCSRYWMYFTRDFFKTYYFKRVGPCPYVISSTPIGKYSATSINLIRYVNDSIMKNGGALPVRCIKSGDLYE